jgi:hypothetical protein
VGKGFNSSGIMEALNWNSKNRNFYLFDTFCGLVEDTLTLQERLNINNKYGGVNNYNQFTESERSNINRIFRESTQTKKKILNKISTKPDEKRKYEKLYGISSDIIRKINTNIKDKKRRGLIGISKQERQQIINKINPSLKKIEIIEEELSFKNFTAT